MTWYPNSMTKIQATMAMVIGGLAGWLTHPAIWLAFGPFRWTAFLLATAAQESGFNPNAAGDGGRSIGLLQFYDTTWEYLGMEPISRYGGLAQGWAAAVYVQAAIGYDPRWAFWLALPLVGPFFGRVLWRFGIDELDGDMTAALDTVRQEGRFPDAWRYWRWISLIPAALTVGAIYKARDMYPKKKTRR